jgi:hypothetical protein
LHLFIIDKYLVILYLLTYIESRFSTIYISTLHNNKENMRFERWMKGTRAGRSRRAGKERTKGVENRGRAYNSGIIRLIRDNINGTCWRSRAKHGEESSQVTHKKSSICSQHPTYILDEEITKG